jgi:hypothetical protein
MLIVLAAATRMKGGAGWVAAIASVVTIPAYLIPYALTLQPEYFLYFVYPVVTVNMLFVPLIWFFVQSQLSKSFRISWRTALHLIPAVLSLAVNIAFYSPLSLEEIAEDMKQMQAGRDNIAVILNNILFAIQLVTYFPYMIVYVRRKKKFMENNFSDSGYHSVKWIEGFVYVWFGLSLSLPIIYAITAHKDMWIDNVWINPVMNCLGMAYLVYTVIFHSTHAYINRLPDAPENTGKHENTASLPLSLPPFRTKQEYNTRTSPQP